MLYTRKVNKTQYQKFLEKFPKKKGFSYIIFAESNGKIISVESDDITIQEYCKNLDLRC